MKILALLLPAAAAAFSAASRRDFFSAAAGLATAAPLASRAVGLDPSANSKSSRFIPDDEVVEGQMWCDSRIDINNSPVTDYKFLKGMYPHAAGKIVSHGPFRSVRDIYRIAGLTDLDKQQFRKYEKNLIANPPGRAFIERINQRQSL